MNEEEPRSRRCYHRWHETESVFVVPVSAGRWRSQDFPTRIFNTTNIYHKDQSLRMSKSLQNYHFRWSVSLRAKLCLVKNHTDETLQVNSFTRHKQSESILLQRAHLSPSLNIFICFEIKHAKSGPVRAAGSGRSISPPSQTSILLMCPYTCRIFSTRTSLPTTSRRSDLDLILLNPQKILQSL